MNDILVPVSPGELLDKITILRIKVRRMGDAAKIANVRRELESLEGTWRAAAGAEIEEDVRADVEALMSVNEALWIIEDDIRSKERIQRFDEEFVRLARSVYVQNDARAALKRRINVRLGSKLIEEKSYAGY